MHDATRKFPFKGSVFDVVYSSFVIEHIKDGPRFVGEIRRVLKSNGKAIIRTADIERCGMWFYTDYTRVQPYTKVSLYRLMADNGFDVKELSYGITPPGFIMKRIANAIIFLPKFIQDFYFKRICTLVSYEIYVVATKV